MSVKPPAASRPIKPFAQRKRPDEVKAAATAPVTPAAPAKPVKMYDVVIAPRNTYSAGRTNYGPGETITVSGKERKELIANGTIADPDKAPPKEQSHRPLRIEQFSNKVGLVDSQVR